MAELKIATFNCENLLMRCDFSQAGIAGAARKLTAVTTSDVADRVDDVFNVLSEDDRTLTAQALAATRADLCALQEVENLVTLTAFHNRYLMRWSPHPYPTRILHEGNDSRGIDVALLSRIPVIREISHAARTYDDLGVTPPKGVPGNSRAFRRDCLEVDVLRDGKSLTVFICHFKSMHGGRQETRKIRAAEARSVRALIEQRFHDPANADWIILGDLNDYTELDGIPVHDHGLNAWTEDGFAIDLAQETVPDPLMRWSHYYPRHKTYAALDHIFLSPRMARINRQSSTRYIRAGAPWRCQRHTGYRLPGVGWSNPKASDHCPLVATIHFTGNEPDAFTQQPTSKDGP